MAYVNPYQTAAIEQDLITSLIKSKQSATEGELEGRMQKGEMIREYGKDVRDKTSKIEAKQRAAAAAKRKKNPFELLIPLITAIATGPLGAGISAGLAGGYGAYSDASFAEKTAKNLQKYIRSTPLAGTGKEGFDPWQGTFLSEKAADFKQGRLGAASDLDSVIRAAKKAGSIGNVLGTAATSGLMAYGLSSMLGGGTSPAEGVAGTPVFDEALGKFVLPEGALSASQVLAGPKMGIFQKMFKGPQMSGLFKGDNLYNMLFKGGANVSNENQAAFQYLLQTLGALQDY
jgi:hypothetical protein